VCWYQGRKDSIVIALKDPVFGNLDRVQMIKGWRDQDGELHEKVYDISWSDNRKPDPIPQSLNESGELIVFVSAPEIESLICMRFTPDPGVELQIGRLSNLHLQSEIQITSEFLF